MLEKCKREYDRWLSHPSVSQNEKAVLKGYSDNDILLYFKGRLTFGTAGLRGIMAPGTGAMNVHTVAHATRALASVIRQEGRCDDGVVIACDSRCGSEEFARTAAAVMAHEGIKCYIFDSLRPTPVLSFAVRELECAAGINITASHNPKEYNGYKAYWDDGAQLSPALADRVARAGDGFDVLDCPGDDFDTAVAQGKITVVGPEIDEKYIECVLMQRVCPEKLENARDMSIVYTPLNGAGYILVPEVLKRAGIKNLYLVESQSKPDGTFPTTPYPNPEYKDVFLPGIELADRVGADFVIATDPDADRMGIAVREKSGEFVCLTGNQVGCLLLDYIIRSLKEQNRLPARAYAVKSFVTTELASRIAAKHGVDMFNVFTGFKYIGEKMTCEEDASTGREFLLGFEESYGYLRGTYARDKDAVVASMLVAEAAAHYNALGMTLYDAMEAVYKEYGYFADIVSSVRMEGVEGAERIASFMKKIRTAPPCEIGGFRVTGMIDYLIPEMTNCITGEKTPLDTGKADSVYFTMGDTVAVMRPSGTEPLVKFYAMASGSTMEDAREKAERIIKACKETV